MDRERQIEFLVAAEERVKGYFSRWIKDPKFRAALHRHDDVPERDGEPTDAGRAQRRAACG